MRALAAFRDGVRRVNRAPHLVAGMFLVTLLVALPLSVALRGMIEAHLGGSLAAETLASDVNYEWWQEFSAHATGLGTTFVPSVIGFGAVLNNLSGLFDNIALATTIAGATIAWLVIWSFLSGGVLDRFARNRPTRTAGFFAACGTHFWRFLRLGILGAFVYWFLFELLHPLLFEDAYGRLIRDVTVERRGFAIRLAGYVLFGSVLVFCTMLFDFARVRIVVEDRRSSLGALLASVRFVRRHLGAVAGLYLLNGLIFVLLLAIYAAVSPGAPRSGLHMTAVLLIGELYILARHYLKLLFYASQTALFQGALAHVEYTAAPVIVWPDSPAVEAISNAAPRDTQVTRRADVPSDL
jgi:hypothetical protein